MQGEWCIRDTEGIAATGGIQGGIYGGSEGESYRGVEEGSYGGAKGGRYGGAEGGRKVGWEGFKTSTGDSRYSNPRSRALLYSNFSATPVQQTSSALHWVVVLHDPPF